MIYLQRVVAGEPFNKSAPEGIESRLPEGFPFLIDGYNGQVVEPALEYLHGRFVLKHGYGSHAKLTVDTVAYELKHFFEYLRKKGLRWNEVQVQDIRTYRDEMYASVSPRTGEPVGVDTIRRRVELVVDLYFKAAKRGRITPLELDQEEVRVRLAIDRTPLAHLGTTRTRSRFSVVPKRSDRRARRVRYLSPEQAKSLLTELGPLPSPTSALDPHHWFRDRVIVELMLHTGIRRIELLGLQCSQFQGIAPNPDYPYAAQRLRLTITKGGIPRTVLVPNYIVAATRWYIDNERKKALEQNDKHGYPRSGTLFLHHSDAHGVAGRPLSADALRSLLKDAQTRAGLTEHKARRTTRGEASTVVSPLITLHGLRHTFAVWTYWSRKAQGDPEPWKYIQAALGHRSLQTTLDIYLQVVALDELRASDHLERFHKVMRDA